MGVATTVLLPPAPRLVWNMSASAPVGLYLVVPATRLHVGDMVVARAPEPYRHLAARRHYLALNVPLVKRVAATAGDRVCAQGQGVFVNGRRVAERQVADGAGRAMPWWNGCRTLGNGGLFLLTDARHSFDARYFGVSTPEDVLGRARLLWAKP